MKTITLKQDGYEVSGELTVETYCGTRGAVQMHCIPISKLTKDKILKACNDGGFGAGKVIDAHITISAIYPHTTRGGWNNFIRDHIKTLYTRHPLHTEAIRKSIVTQAYLQP